MEPMQICNQEDLRKLFDQKQIEIGNMAKEIAEREWELFEFNLFVSSMGKEKLDDATNSVKKLRKMESVGKINLEEYEDLAEDFED